MNVRKLPHKNLLALGIIVLLLLAGVSYVLMKRQDVNRQVAEKVTINGQSVDMEPAKPEDNAAINEQKKNGTLNQPQPQPESISVSISRTNQTLDKTLQIRVMVIGAIQGQCSLELTKGIQVVTRRASVVSRGTYYGCDGFDVSPSELSAGEWKAKVTVQDGQRQSSAEQTVTVVN